MFVWWRWNFKLKVSLENVRENKWCFHLFNLVNIFYYWSKRLEIIYFKIKYRTTYFIEILLNLWNIYFTDFSEFFSVTKKKMILKHGCSF